MRSILLILALVGPLRADAQEPGPGATEILPPLAVDLPPVPYPSGVDAGEGRVEVEATIGVDGRVTDVVVVSGDAPFVQPVIQAVRGGKFRPATQGGEPVAVVVPLVFEFPRPPVNVAGVLLRRGDRAPLAGVPIRVGDRLVHTDEEGRFELRNVAPGSWTLDSPDPAVRLEETPLVVTPRERVDLELYGTEETWLHEALGLYRPDATVATRRTLTAAEIASSPGALGDPVRAIQNLPGVVRTPLDTGWLLVRGGSPDDTRVFLDGVEIPLLYHLGGFTSIVHPRLVEGVDFWPGAPPARLGRSLSGAAEIRLRPPGEDAVVAGGVNLAWAHAFAEVPVGKEGGFAVAARRSYLDVVLDTFLGDQAGGIAPRFWDVSVRLGGPRADLTLIGISDTADAPLGDGTVAVVGQQAAQVQGRVEADTPWGELQVRPWVAVHRQHIDAPTRTESVLDVFPGLRADLSSEPWEGTEVRVGLEGEHHRWAIARDGDVRSVPWTSVDPYGDVSFGDRVRARLGLRLETLLVQGQLPRAGLSPRADLRWQATDGLALVGEVARTHQPPLALHLLGMPDGPYLGLERSTGAAVGLRWEERPVGLDLDLWGRRVQGVSAREADGSLGAVDGLAYGLEATARVELAHTRAQLIYQLARSRTREEPGDWLSPSRYDQPHRVNVIVSRRLPRSWELGARWRFASGFSAEPGTVAFDLLTQEEVLVAVDAQGRLAPYHGLDVRISKRFAWRTWHLEAYVDVQNVYARRVPEPTINGIDESILAYGFGLPFLPIFGVEGIFWP